MIRRPRSRVVAMLALLAALSAAWSLPLALPAGDTAELSGLLPGGALVRVAVPDGASLAQRLPQLADTDGAWPGRLGELVAGWLASTPGGTLEPLLSGSSALALYAPRTSTSGAPAGPRSLVVVTRPVDRAAADAALAGLFSHAASTGRPTNPGRHRGLRYERAGRSLVAGWMDGLLIAASDEQGLAGVVDCSLDGPADALTGASASGTLLGFAVDARAWQGSDLPGMQRLRRSPLGRQGLPAIALTEGTLHEILGGAVGCAGVLRADGTRLVLELRLGGPPDQGGDDPAGGPDAAERGVLTLPASSRTLATLALHVDLAGIWRRRETLAPDDVQPRLARLDTDLTALFAGRSLAEDVLARLAPELGLVVDAGDGAPDDPTAAASRPSVCLVARLADDAVGLAPLLAVAFQGAVVQANLERADTGGAPFLLRSREHRGVVIHAAGQLGEDDGAPDAAALAWLAPALAVVGPRVLVGTSEPQVVRLVDALLDGQIRSWDGVLALDADLPALAAEGARAATFLAARVMVAEGLDAEAARARVTRFLDALAGLGQLGLGIRRDARDLVLEAVLDPDRTGGG